MIFRAAAAPAHFAAACTSTNASIPIRLGIRPAPVLRQPVVATINSNCISARGGRFVDLVFVKDKIFAQNRSETVFRTARRSSARPPK